MMNKKSATKYGLIYSGLVMLAACTAPTQTTLSDGTVGYRIDCSASSRGLNFCFEKAGKTCGADGYTVYAEDGRTVSRISSGDADINSVVSEYEGDRNSILIGCGT